MPVLTPGTLATASPISRIAVTRSCVGAALGYLCFRFADIDWQATHPNLGKLYTKLMQRPSLADTAPHD